MRAVTLPDDPELFTRHEVLEAPPDLLVTNYSMLEYMLMRPLERPIFDATRTWLADNPNERLMLVVDEAHLYRGAAGAEVGLLLRRLRARLGITPERLQVIATSASFNDAEHARTFAAQLTGKAVSDFDSILGELARRRAKPAEGRLTRGSCRRSFSTTSTRPKPKRRGCRRYVRCSTSVRSAPIAQLIRSRRHCSWRWRHIHR